MRLIIVESPTKALTIKKFLGEKYKILASFGHIRDLPKNELGINIEKNFEPKYVIIPKAKRIVSELKKEAAKSETNILATDEDREGEAIAWHLSEVLGLKAPKRIVFHEITKPAIEQALKNPRTIDMNLVDSQQARRILDRIVGYKLSPFLWKKVAKGLSAGRVQSVAVRLVVEREREREKFVPQEYWQIAALLKKLKTQNSKLKIDEFSALLVKKDGKTIPKLVIKTKKEADEIVNDLKNAEYKVIDLEKKEIKKNPLPPFTTSTLQQTASQKLGFSAKKTMQIAQQLYERGLTTYHRTDSLNLSDISLSSAKKFIIENYGKEYWAGFFKKYKTKSKSAQEAHEAIRPTFVKNTPEKLKLDENQFKLYDLIWRRFVACQMNQAIFDSISVDIGARNYTFRATGQTLKFNGFLKVYPLKFQEAELPLLEKNEVLKLIKLIPSQHFTEPPPRYNEASLIKTLEKYGIGRPSTYAPILSTIQERNYVKKDNQKRFVPTEIGKVVNDILTEHFPQIVDIQFTAKMEKELDEIAKGKDSLIKTCREFYEPFSKNLEKKYKEVSKSDITDKPTDKICPKCKTPLVERLGRFGKFYACPQFPKCRYVEPLEEKILNIKCPKCQKGELVEKTTRPKIGNREKIFYACNRFPDCDFALWDKPINEFCPKCNSLLVEKNKEIKCSNKECDFKKQNVKFQKK